MTTVFLGIGSNMDDPPAQLQMAVAALRLLPGTRMQRISPTYASKAWGKTDQPDFLNMVVQVETDLQPAALLEQVKQIEAAQGRLPGERWGPRPVDIDILLYDKLTINTPTLVIPHPRMWERAFVLRPLSDLLPDLCAPDGTLISVLLKQVQIASQGVWPASHSNSADKSESDATRRK
jgi:2-amino-4-hydroxy-6-hydroxymethyldihydropteridine diphosphokinase